MRVECIQCGKRFDIGHVAVLREAERLRLRARDGDVPDDAREGNVLSPAEALARLCRAVIDHTNSPPLSPDSAETEALGDAARAFLTLAEDAIFATRK